jgi:uncharacterized membrane protein
MSATAHLWAIGFDDMARADQVRDAIAKLGWDNGDVEKYIILLDMAVVVRHPDGSFTLNREPFFSVTNIVGGAVLGFLVGLVLAVPLAGATAGALLAGLSIAAAATSAKIDDAFIREVEALMTPGSFALFVLDHVGDLEVILHTIRGLGGKVLKTNVDLERAKLVQATLAQK